MKTPKSSSAKCSLPGRFIVVRCAEGYPVVYPRDDPAAKVCACPRCLSLSFSLSLCKRHTQMHECNIFTPSHTRTYTQAYAHKRTRSAAHAVFTTQWKRLPLHSRARDSTFTIPMLLTESWSIVCVSLRSRCFALAPRA